MKKLIILLIIPLLFTACKDKEEVNPQALTLNEPVYQEGSFTMTISDIDARTWTCTSYNVTTSTSTTFGTMAYVTAKNTEGDLQVTLFNSDLGVPTSPYSNGITYNDSRYSSTHNGISGYNQHHYKDVKFTITEKTNKYVRGTFVVNSQPTDSHYTPPKITSGEFKLYYKEGNTLYFQ